MIEASARSGFSRLAARLLCAGLIVLLIAAGTAGAADPVLYSLCDVRVLYLYEEAGSIDWPTLYYLNENFGCRIDLVTAREGNRPSVLSRAIENREIYHHTVYFPESDSLSVGSAALTLFSDRLPDIVLYAESDKDIRSIKLREEIVRLATPGDRLFNILKIYRKHDPDLDKKGSRGSVVLNGRELFKRYRDRMALEVPSLFPTFDIDAYQPERMIRWVRTRSNLGTSADDDNFLARINSLRVNQFIDSLFPQGPMKMTVLKQAQKFISYFNASRLALGQQKAGLIVDGYRELTQLNRHRSATAQIPEFQTYLGRLLDKAEWAALDAVGITWEGRIVTRDSPHGQRLKYVVSISADGPKEVEVSRVNFHPYWDTTVVVLDQTPVIIAPHQSFTKEFLVEIDDEYLTAEQPDSLQFSVEVAYGQIPLVFTSSLPIWEAAHLTIRFEPDYHFVAPFPSLEIDRVVSNLNLKAVITKPYNFSGVVGINLQTPRGLFAGAYRKDVQLEKGSLTETVRIPFTISNLFELGIQQQTIELLVDDRIIAADTGRIRIAACEIADTVKVGFLPDSLGMLEDILRMTDAAYRPMTDRSLITSDLDAYNVIVFGSGCHRGFPSLKIVKGRLEKYLRAGGSIVIFGQPEDWPGDVLPVSFVPTREVVDNDNITNRIPEARVLSHPYSISDKNLLSSFFRKREVSPAVISPAERVFVTPRGGALLSVSRLGDGQIIFCGLPLLEMVARLDIDAIHLFANLLNY